MCYPSADDFSLLVHYNQVEEAGFRQHFEPGIEVKVPEPRKPVPRGYNLQQQVRLVIAVVDACGAQGRIATDQRQTQVLSPTRQQPPLVLRECFKTM